MGKTVKLKMTLNRLIKLKAQLIEAIKEARTFTMCNSDCVTITINKWSKSTTDLAAQITAKRAIAELSFSEYRSLINALSYVKSVMYQKNMELNISDILLDLEKYKAYLSMLTMIYGRIPNDSESTKEIIDIEGTIADIKANIQKVEGSEASEFVNFALMDKSWIMDEILHVKKDINSLEDKKLALNSNEFEVEISEVVAKKLALV